VKQMEKNMKLEKISLTFAAVLALGLASCSKNEPATSTAADANKAATVAKAEGAKAADSAKDEAARVADAAKAEAAKTADAAKAEATKAADNAKTQGFIDKAKSLIADGKLSDASTVLQQLAGLSVSSDQQKLVDALKEQIQKALAAKAAEKAAGSVGDLLKK
jgi:colicin import membrane protein